MWRRVPKLSFTQCGLSKFFTVCNFRYSLAMPIIFFPKCLRFDVDSRNGTKNWEKVLRFLQNCIWIGSCKLSQSSTGYLPSAVYVLTNTPKISRRTSGNIFQMNFPQNDGKTWKQCSHGDFGSFRNTFTCSLSKRVPKRMFSQSGVMKLFTVSNFANTLVMTIAFFFQNI